MTPMTAAKAAQIFAHMLAVMSVPAPNRPVVQFNLEVRIIKNSFQPHLFRQDVDTGEAVFMFKGKEGKRFHYSTKRCPPLETTKEWNYPAAFGQNGLSIISPARGGFVCTLTTFPEN